MNEFKKCLKNKKVIRASGIEVEIKAEVKSAKEDLKDAKDLFKRRRFKFATVAGYYSLFHSARALLYSRGYREKSHYCLRTAIEELFVKQGLIEPEELDFFDDAVGLREAADYEGVYSKDGAQRAIKGAKKFLSSALKILEGKL